METGVPLELDDAPYGSELSDGRIRYFDNRAVKVGDGISFTWRDVTERVEQRQRLARQALTDPLTGLANRQRLLDAMDEACGRVEGSGGAAALLYCDLDGLKAINDRLGHEAGDIVLRAVGDRMRGAVRTADVVARLGGDEFVVLAEGIRDDESALALALKVADAVTRPLLVSGEELLPRISFGVAVCAARLDAGRPAPPGGRGPLPRQAIAHARPSAVDRQQRLLRRVERRRAVGRCLLRRRHVAGGLQLVTVAVRLSTAER